MAFKFASYLFSGSVPFELCVQAILQISVMFYCVCVCVNQGKGNFLVSRNLLKF